MNILLLIIAFLFLPIGSFAQSPEFGNAYNSKTGKKDICIKMRTEDGTTTESKRCKELRITTGYFTEEDEYFLLNAGSGVSDATSMTSAETAVPLSFAHIKKAIATDPAFSTGTLADGIANQTITITITENPGTLTWVLTPTTTTGFTSITFYRPGDYATLVFMPGNIGWIIFSRGGVTIETDNPLSLTKRIVNNDSPYTVLSKDQNIFADTDGGAITINLPAGFDSRELFITNTGSSGNAVTISPNGTDLFFGSNSDFDLLDLENLDFMFNISEGWR